MDKKIPFATRDRYPNYLRVLRYFQAKGLDKIMSNDLARELGINSTSVRRDISYLGHMGRQGYGYNISTLIDELKKELGDGKDEGIVLMGVGNMGKALLKYNTFSYVWKSKKEVITMKKILAMIIAFAFVFALLVGCNETADTESGNESVLEQSIESKNDAAESEALNSRA